MSMIKHAFDSVTELSWPPKGYVLFDNADDWYHNACLNWGFERWVNLRPTRNVVIDSHHYQ
jgi:hypothetical protein